jgi:tetratricopeptide (TPR) repeat protein
MAVGVKAVVIGVIGVLLGGLPIFSQSASSAQQIQSHLRQAQEFLRTDRPDLAVGEFKAILTLDPNNVTARGDLGTLLYFQGDYEKAAVDLRAALKSNPALWKTQTLLGMCEKRTGHMTSARADLEKAFPQLQEEKLRVEAGMELIEIYYASRDLDKAADVVSVLRRLKPDDAGILYTAHRIYSEQADEAMLGVSMLAPNSAWMHQLMAQEMVRQGNTEGAIAHYREALRIGPRIPGLHFELAEVLSGASSDSDQQQAEKEYQSALAQNPFDEKSECRLGKIAVSRSDLKGAFAYYSRALELQPDDPEANLGLGRVLLSMDQPKKAQPLLESAVRLDPSDPAAHYRLGSLYRQMGRSDDARRELAEFQHLKQMKARLGDLYKEMRLQTKPQQLDGDIPQ